MHIRICIAACGLSISAAHADDLYGLDENLLVFVDADAAVAVVLGDGHEVVSLAAAPGALYALFEDTGEVYEVVIGEDVEYMFTGVALDPLTVALAYNLATGEMFAATRGDVGDPASVFSVDLETGDILSEVILDNIEDYPAERLSELQFDDDGVAYISIALYDINSDQTSADLFTLDLDTAELSLLEEIAYSTGDGDGAGLTGFAPRRAGGFWGSYFEFDFKGFYRFPLISFEPGPFDLWDEETYVLHDIAGLNDNLEAIAVVPVAACAADVNGDGSLDVLDFVAFQQLFLTQDPDADCNADDAFTILDFVCFQQLFQGGCR